MRSTGIFAILSLMAATLPAAAQPAPPQPAPHTMVCLRIQDIQSTTSKDGKILTFRMRDGTIYNNHLRQTCDDLRFGGFAWSVNASEQVCENVQTLRTLTTGQMCRLGLFDPPVRPAAKPATK